MDGTDNNEVPVQQPIAPTPAMPGNLPLIPSRVPQAPPTNAVVPPQQTPGGPNLPTQAPAMPTLTPEQQHASTFQKVFGVLSGGGQRPQKDAQGNPIVDPATGQVKMQQGSVKQLGAGILAGALASMMAGMATPPSYTKFGNASVPNYSGSFAAGAQAGQQFTQQGAKTAAQKEADDLRTRQFTTFKQNLDMHLLMQSVHRGDRQDMEQAANDYAEKIDDLEAAQAKGNIKDKDGNPMDLLMDGYYTKEQGLEMLQKKQISSVNDQLIPAKVVDAPVDPNDPSKGYHPVMMFKVATNAALGNVELTDDMVKDLPDRYKTAVGSTVPVQLLFKDASTKAHAHQAAGTAADWQEEYDKLNPTAKTTEGFNYEAWSKNNPGEAKALNPWLLAHKGQHVDEAISGPKGILENPDFRKDGKAVAAFAKLQSDMGIKADALNKVSEKRQADVLELKNREAEDRAAALEAAKEKTPEGQAKLESARLDVTLKRQQVAQNDATAKAVQVPTGFVADPRANELDSNTLRSQLTSKGVTVPPDWEALYSIGHNDADLATYTSSPRKGVQTMPRPQALAFIRTYINPNFNEGDFKANANLIKEIRDTKVGTAGGSLMAGGVAAQHLDMLQQAADALKNNNIQLLNSIAAKYGIATGSAAPVVFKAIGQKLNEEVEKVTSGGTPQVASLKEAHDNLNVAQSPEQIQGVINAYVGLMNGRYSEIDTRANQYTGRHIPVSPMAAKVFNKNGYKVPGQPDLSYKPYIVNGLIVGWTKDGKSMVQTQLYR